MKRIIFLVTLFLFSIFTLYSCKERCNKENLGSFTLNELDLKIVPYNGNEDLVFCDSLNNTIRYEGKIRKSNFSGNVYFERNSHLPADCRGSYYYSEINYTRFTGNDNKTDIWFDLAMSDPFNGDIKKSIFIRVSYIDSIQWYFGSSFYFDSLVLYDIPNSNGCITSFNDSLMIGSEKFYSVYMLKQNAPQKLGYIEILYYSIDKGILGFRTDKGKLWHLN
jgi:hypothetical protein